MARKYELRRRAERMEETRRRITEAAVELHGTVGPARTTISAIAEQAGVERLTVYRHFPTDVELYEACSSHWLAANPPPDPEAWGEIEDPETRLRAALGELYAWYGRTERMMENVLRDGPSVPALAEQLAGWEAYLVHIQDLLASAWGARGRSRRLLRAAIGHALELHTWSSLARRGLTDGDAVELMARLVRSSVSP